MNAQTFRQAFKTLTGHPPFPWQEALYRKFLQGVFPETCSLPTGLGKTSIIAVWLIALAEQPKLVPRRLVYVVNRRTVVDQTTIEVEKLRENLSQCPEIEAALRTLCAISNHDDSPPLAISTLRGQFADNQAWSSDPARPAVICGTVDMIGSRLLFSGYRIGFKSRPLHAGFLGHDALLVHDEAHLEPAFQRLVESIRDEQARERPALGERNRLRVIELSATARGQSEPFHLTNADHQHPVVQQRLQAVKQLALHPLDDEKQGLVDAVVAKALENEGSGRAVLIFLRSVEDVSNAAEKLRKHDKQRVETLTGTMRGLERDRMADPRRPDASRVFARFLKPPQPDAPEHEQWKVEPLPGTVYLLCTSAGEVGVNISADDLVCDLSTFDSMAQRFGRVNRFGDRDDTTVDVFCPKPESLDEKDGLTPSRKATLALLRHLEDVSPRALSKLMNTLTDDERRAAFAPEPTILPATDIHFDAWSMTTIREKMPGRPPVEPYLHGVAEWEPPRSSVAWRKDVEEITDELIGRRGQGFPQDLLADYPLKPHELLSDTTERVYKQLQQLIAEPKASVKGAKRQKALERARSNAAANIWLIDDSGTIKPTTLSKLLSQDKKRATEQLDDSTVLLPPSVGGLTATGMLDGTTEKADDVADITSGTDQRIRIHPDDADYKAKLAKALDMRRVRSIELSANDEEEDEPRRWDWYQSFPLEGGRTARKPVAWQTHVDDVAGNAKRIVPALSLPQRIANAVILAAVLHDHGKRRERFQTTLGNRRYPDQLWAKSGKRGARLPEPFRHEFASVLDAQADERLNALDDEMKDLVLHLIATHHGRARPHFNRDEAFDPERPSSDAEALAIETPRRFARLQRKYGRWGLAYLESLLRAADWAASANPSAYVDESENVK